MIYIFSSAGRGTRLISAGIKPPKPLVRILGKELLLWSISSFSYKPGDIILIVALQHDKVEERLINKLQSMYPLQKILFSELDHLSSGQLESSILGIKSKNLHELEDQEIVIHNCDSSYHGEFLQRYFTNTDAFGLIPYFVADGDHWSFLELDPLDSMKVIKIVEKNRLSQYCSIGTYAFNSFHTFITEATDYLRRNLFQKESFVAPFCNHLIEKGYQFSAVKLEAYKIFGTVPEILHFFPVSYNELLGENSLTGHQRKTFIVDIDKTLCHAPLTQDYSTCKPIPSVCNKLRELDSLGCYIVLFTARNFRSFSGSVGLINKYTAPKLLEWLKSHSVPFDEIYFGKPWGYNPHYVDDLSMLPDALVGY